MQFPIVLLSSLAYIALLFFTAWWVDRRADRGQSIVRNPYIYSLSLAVYCTAWTFYGSVGRASTSGLSFLAIYLGPTLIAPLWFFLLRKMVLISKRQRITSIADFISSRYGKNAFLAGLVTVIGVLGCVPYISIQLKAVTFGIDAMTGTHYAFFRSNAPVFLDATFWVTLAMAVFTILFGTRKLDPNERHEGLVAAIAFESLVKLIAFLAIGIFITFHLYDGFDDLFQKALDHPEARRLFSLDSSGISPLNWNILLLLSALAILMLPRQFHISVVENTHPKHITTAMWMFPLYLLLINVFVLPIALAGNMAFGTSIAPDTFVLSLPMSAKASILALMAFLGGLSAATGMIIVSSTALSIMVGNHLVVPLLIRSRIFRYPEQEDSGNRLLFIRRVSIVFVLLLAYLYLRTVGADYDLVSVGLISFTAVAQFGPAALGGMFWKRATPQGAIAGLLTGFLIWAYTLPLPSIADAGFISSAFETEGLWGYSWLQPRALFGLDGLDPISHAAFWSLFLNLLVYGVVSLYTKPSTLALTQADLFVNIEKYESGRDYDIVKREANRGELQQVLARFLGEARTRRLFAEYDRKYELPVPYNAMAAGDLVTFAERHLAGAIGAASAHLVIETIAKAEPITLEEMMQVLEQTQEVLQYSKALEAKSAELEATTRQLTAANEQLKTLDRLKADFITTVTHELRTPVTSIKALSKIILDYRNELSDEKIQGYLEILVSESERISRLINQVLDLEKIESGAAQPVPFQRVDFTEIVEGTLRGMEQLFLEKKVTCSLQLKERPVLVYGNRDQLIQIVVNLLSNALKFAPDNGSGRVDVAVAPKNGMAVLEVRDNGIGISKEQQEHIFDKFTQLHDVAMGKPQGSGLGLFITQKIIERHGGTIQVESQENLGAVFKVRLPQLKQVSENHIE